MRAPGHPQGCFITEILMDELADAVKMDPVEFRIKNLPPEAPNAMWRSYLAQGAKEFGWDKRHATGDPTPGPIKTGMGVSVNTWGGGGRGPSQARVEIAADGGVVVRCGTQDLGTGTRTLVAVVAADTLGLPANAIKPEIGDTSLPFSGASGGSTTAASVSPAIRIASVKALDELRAKVAPALKVSADTLVASNGRIHVKGTPSKGMAWKDACKLIGPQPISVEGEWQAGLSSVTTSGVQFAEATVDIETGIVKVTRVLVVQDCGLIVSKLTAESQVYGGVIGSLNYALFEDRILDRVTGQMVNPNMEWYMLAGHVGCPEDRRPAHQSARARRHRNRRTADCPDGIRDRARGPERHRRHGAEPAADARENPADAGRARREAGGQMKAFAYINPTNEKDAVAALSTEPDKVMPIGGGQDLLARMKDYITQPDRIVNVKNALDATVTATPAGGLRIGAAVKIADLAENAQVARMYPAVAAAASEVGTPQIRNQGTVGGNLNQRPRCWYFRNEEFVCFKKGGFRCFSVSGENQFNAIFGDGPSFIVHPSSLAVPSVAYGATFRLVGPNGEREVPAAEYFTMPTMENVRRENVLAPNELLTHVTLPPPGNVKSGHYEVRYKTSHDWPIAFATVLLTMNGSNVGAARIVMGAVAPVPWRVQAAEQALVGKAITEETAAQAAEVALRGAQPLSNNAYKIQVAKTAVKRAIMRAGGLTTV